MARPAPKPRSAKSPAAARRPRAAARRQAALPAPAAPLPPEPARKSKPDPKAAKPAKPAEEAKAHDKARTKLIRDSFTMPREDFDLIAQLKARALEFKRPTKKSELLRAGLQALAACDDARLKTALDGLRVLKTGRPKKKKT